MDIKSLTDAGEVIIMDGDDVLYEFKAKPNFFTDQVMAEHGLDLHALYTEGKGDNKAVSYAYRLVSDMSRNGTEDGSPLIKPEEVEEFVDPLTIRGCVIVALVRYSEMLEKLNAITGAAKKKAKG